MKQTKPNTLLNLIDYTVRQNPRGVMQLGNKYGELPYNYKIPIRVYLKKVCLNIVKNEGVQALLEIHPDKEIFENEFEQKAQTQLKNQKESKIHTKDYKEDRKANAQLHSSKYTHFKKIPFSPLGQDTEIQNYSNFFGSKEEPNNKEIGSNVAIWLIGVVILCMLSFFLMHLLQPKN